MVTMNNSGLWIDLMSGDGCWRMGGKKAIKKAIMDPENRSILLVFLGVSALAHVGLAAATWSYRPAAAPPARLAEIEIGLTPERSIQPSLRTRAAWRSA